jgi:hypothetical protein
MRWLKKLLTIVLVYIAVYLPYVVLMQALTGYDYTGAYAAVTGVGAVELIVGGMIKIAEAREEQKLKFKDQTCNNSSENSKYSLNYCEESEDIEEITEIPEDENEFETETFE